MPRWTLFPTVVRVLPIAATVVIAISVVGIHDFSVGVDAGIHNSFAEQLVEHHQWPLPASSFMSNIPHYPPAAHAIGAAVGFVLGSTFSGMLFVNAIAFVVSCLALSYFLRRASAAETVASLVIFLILCLIFRKHRFVVGNEIVANFFYGQFAGTAALLTSFVILTKTQRRFGRWLALAALCTHAVGWFFPLSAIHLSIAAAVLRLRPSLNFENFSTRAIECFLTAAALSAIAFFHPTMADMKAISTNDGGISVSSATMLISILFLSFAAVPLLLIFSQQSNLRDPCALISLIFGAIVPPVLQFGLFHFFDLGSPYAVKKSGFLTGTLSLIAAAVLILEWAQFKRLALTLTYRPILPYVSILVPPVMAAILLATVFTNRAFTSASDISRYTNELKSFRLSVPSNQLDGQSISFNSKYNSHINYVVGVAQLHPTAESQLTQNALLPPDSRLIKGAKLAVVAAKDAERVDPSCKQFTDTVLTAILTSCVAALLQQTQ